jgi:hypothetical protein
MSQLPTNELFPAPTDFGADPRPISGAYNLTRTNYNIDPLVNGIDVWMVRPIRYCLFHPEIRKIKKGRN